jgi:hypothetical protein
MSAKNRFLVAMALVIVQAVIGLALFEPTSHLSMGLAILSSVVYPVFFWRRREWARWVVILVSASSLLLVIPHILKHQIAQQVGDIVLVPVAIGLLLLVFSRPVKEQFQARPLF